MQRLAKGIKKSSLVTMHWPELKGLKNGKSSNAFTLEVKEYDLLNRVIEKQTQDSQGHTLTRNKYIYTMRRGQLAQVIGYHSKPRDYAHSV